MILLPEKIQNNDWDWMSRNALVQVGEDMVYIRGGLREHMQ